MNVRPTLALVAVFGLLGLGVWYFEFRGPPATPTPDPKSAPIFDLKADEVARFEVIDAGKSTAVERADDGKWRLVAPQEDDVDARRVEDAVTRVARLTATRKLEDSGDLASFGLAGMPTRLAIKMKDGSSQELLIGSRTPDSAAYYVKRADSSVVFVAPTLAIADLARWGVDPPKPRPTPTPQPLTPSIETPKPPG